MKVDQLIAGAQRNLNFDAALQGTPAKQVVCFTGFPDGAAKGHTRKSLTERANAAGHKVVQSITARCTLLVSSYENAKEGSAKYIQASDKNVRVISYAEFLNLL